MSPSHTHDTVSTSNFRLVLAIAINVLLTLVQCVFGIISGSLSLIADALHNLNDAAALGIALFARKISTKPADAFKTFGYRRAEVIAALINVTALIIVGLFLIGQALWRFVEPLMIEGWTVIIVASIALIVDIITAMMTYRLSKESMNMQAAFMHNVSDALASVGVVLSGIFILLFEWYWTDTVLTLIIASYILWQASHMLPHTIHLLMEAMPAHITLEDVICAMETVEAVENVHHVHIWQLDEHRTALEAHVVVHNHTLPEIEHIKTTLKTILTQQFQIAHSTLEIETRESTCDYQTRVH